MWVILILILLAALIASWVLTCGIIFLICLCFGWAFDFAIATGIWLIILLLKGIFSHKDYSNYE